jgi:hypothetical protein
MKWINLLLKLGFELLLLARMEGFVICGTLRCIHDHVVCEELKCIEAGIGGLLVLSFVLHRIVRACMWSYSLTLLPKSESGHQWNL